MNDEEFALFMILRVCELVGGDVENMRKEFTAMSGEDKQMFITWANDVRKKADETKVVLSK